MLMIKFISVDEVDDDDDDEVDDDNANSFCKIKSAKQLSILDWN